MSYDEHLISQAGGDGDHAPADLAAIEARIHDCRSYNFGMANANRLAREDAPFLLALVRDQQAKLGRVGALHVPVMEDGNPVGCSLCDWEHPEGGTWPCGTLAAITTTEETK